MRIREATEADAVQAAALWTEAYTGQNSGEGRIEPYDEGELAVAASAGTVLVAEAEAGEFDGSDASPGTVIGIVALVAADSPRGAVARAGEAELARLAIAAGARRRGVGRALARRCLELARRERAARIVLWSRPYQVEAHFLYESLGFRRSPERDGRDPLGRRWVFSLGLESER